MLGFVFGQNEQIIEEVLVDVTGPYYHKNLLHF